MKISSDKRRHHTDCVRQTLNISHSGTTGNIYCFSRKSVICSDDAVTETACYCLTGVTNLKRRCGLFVNKHNSVEFLLQILVLFETS